jgi:hypothetical protein
MNPTTTTAYIEVTGADAIGITSAESARRTRDTLLTMNRGLGRVTCANEATRVADALKDTKAFTRFVEASRTSAKAPVLDFGKRIDGVAKDLTRDLDSEADRLSRLLGGWQAEENRKAEEARRKAWEEEQRIIREAQERERAEAAKAAAIQAELERKASVARNAENAAKYAAEAERRRLQAEAAESARAAAAEQAVIDTRVAAAAVAAPKAEGVSTRSVVKFEVTDIVALYEAAPFLVNLTPNTAAINNALKTLAAGQSLPGVRHWKENLSIVR